MKNIIYLFISSILAIYFGFFAFNKNTNLFLYTNLSYYIISFIILIWIYYLHLIITKEKIYNFFYNHKEAIFLSATIVSLYILICPPEFKILGDETNLLSTSKSLYENHTANAVASEIKVLNKKQTLAYFIDKRMLLFPYCVSIVHSIIGYSHNNAFIVNILACFGSLICFYYLIQLFFGKFYGIIALISLSSYPIFLQYSMSAGYDIFNLFFALLNFIIFYKFLIYKKENYSIFLLYSTLLFAYTRYEATLMGIIVLPFILIHMNKNEFKKQSIISIIYPILFMPIAWIIVFANTHEYLQIKNTSKILFSLEYFSKNFCNACEVLTDFNSEFGSIPIFSIFFIISLLTIVANSSIRQQFKQLIENNISFFIYIFIFLLIQCFVKFSYINGDLTIPIQTRMIVTFIPYMIFLVIFWLYKFAAYNKNKQVILLIIVCFISIYERTNINKICSAYSTRGYNILKTMRNFFERFPDKQNYLIVSPKPSYLLPFGYNVISPQIFNANYENIKQDVEKKIWTNIFFIEQYYDNKLEPYCKINHNGKVDILYEKIIEDNGYLKFSFFSF